MLDSLETTISLLAMFGLGTFALSVIAYGLVGASILRTGAYSTLIGGLLVAAAGSLLAVFIGQLFLPTGVIGTITERTLAGIYLVVGYRLRTEPEQIDRTEPLPDPTGK